MTGDLDKLREEYEQSCYDRDTIKSGQALIAALEEEVRRLESESERQFPEAAKIQRIRAEKAEARAAKWEWVACRDLLWENGKAVTIARWPDTLRVLLARYDVEHGRDDGGTTRALR